MKVVENTKCAISIKKFIIIAISLFSTFFLPPVTRGDTKNTWKGLGLNPDPLVLHAYCSNHKTMAPRMNYRFHFFSKGFDKEKS